MLRRKFILLTASGGTAICMTGLNCSSRKPAFYAVLDKPGQLAHICDTKTIKEIGKAYRLQTPSESGSDQLISLLSADSNGVPLSASINNQYVETLINNKIILDFEKGNMVIVNGWILAVTEARQCALFAINNP